MTALCIAGVLFFFVECGKNGHKFFKICTNTNSMGIEMCDTIRNGKYEVSPKTRANAIAEGRKIVKKSFIYMAYRLMHPLKSYFPTSFYRVKI